MSGLRREPAGPGGMVWRALGLLLFLLVPLAALPTTSAQTASFQGLGSFGPGQPSWAYGVSADGAAVVGFSYHDDTTYTAFRWMATTGLMSLGEKTRVARAASADGFYVVGQGSSGGALPNAYRWNPADGMVALSIYDAMDVSEDGTVIVCCALRWKNGEVTGLPTLGACCTQAFGVSGDGVVVVGSARKEAYANERAFRWTEAGGMVELGVDGKGRTASRDGSVIAGQMIAKDEYHTFRWTAAEGVKDLKTLGGTWSEPFDISADGTVIVGASYQGGGKAPRAFRWTVKKQMQLLKRELLDAGVSAVQNWTLTVATGVSADGTVIVGYGLNPANRYEAFRAVLPIPK